MKLREKDWCQNWKIGQGLRRSRQVSKIYLAPPSIESNAILPELLSLRLVFKFDTFEAVKSSDFEVFSFFRSRIRSLEVNPCQLLSCEKKRKKDCYFVSRLSFKIFTVQNLENYFVFFRWNKIIVFKLIFTWKMFSNEFHNNIELWFSAGFLITLFLKMFLFKLRSAFSYFQFLLKNSPMKTF